MQKNELIHHGVKGQKWGVRHYQKKDGSLTGLGKRRISRSVDKTVGNVNKKALQNESDKLSENFRNAMNDQGTKVLSKESYDKYVKIQNKSLKKIDSLFRSQANKTASRIMAETGMTTKEVRSYTKELMQQYSNGFKDPHVSDFYLNVINPYEYEKDHSR